MNRKDDRAGKAVMLAVVALVITFAAAACISCGSGSKTESSKSSSTKLPLGTTEKSLSKTTTNSSGTSASGDQSDNNSSAEQQTATQESTSTPNVTLDLAGGRFKMVEATRPDSNKAVISGDGREVKGDYMEIELSIENVGTDLIDLSQFTFILESPGIEADTYSDYYGDVGAYGAYYSDDSVTATLLNYSDLQPAACVLKIGETVDKVFLFFDLNPENTARNGGVTKDNTRLIIRKTGGSDYGDEIEMGLTGYPD